jgi:hypothetical protein
MSVCAAHGEAAAPRNLSFVRRGLDPRIHLKKFLAKSDGLPGQARQ